MKDLDQTIDVLLVDDDPDVQLLYSTELRAAGHSVECASDGAAAILTARFNPPRIVILDLGLPLGDGEATLKHLRSRQELNDVPILILSGRSEAEWSEKLNREGANGYLQKPVLPSRLVKTVEQLLGVHDASVKEVHQEPRPPLPSQQVGTLHCPHCGEEIAALNAQLDRDAIAALGARGRAA